MNDVFRLRGFQLSAFSFSLLLAAFASAATSKPHVVVIVADDMRPDCIAALGHPVVRTPELDRLVRQGMTFTRASCAYPLCVPSRAEMLTGCSAFRNGVRTNLQGLDRSLETWPAAMRRGGYHTVHVGKWHVAGRPSERGYDAVAGLYAGGGGAVPGAVDHAGRPVTGYVGWVFQDEQGNKFRERGVGVQPDTSARMAEAAIGVIEQDRAAPLFMQVNFAAPHDPRLWPVDLKGAYDPERIPLPANFRPEHGFDHGNLDGRDERLLTTPRRAADVRAELAVYYAVIEDLDRQVGRIRQALERRGMWEQTIFVFTADNGLALGSHGLVGKQNMYEHSLNVPLVVCGPGVVAGKTSAAECYLRDLYPTFCARAGIAIAGRLDGRDLSPQLAGGRESVRTESIGYFHDAQRAIRRGRWKLIRYPQLGQEQLFDLLDDPHEMRDRAGEARLRETQDALRQALREGLHALEAKAES